MDALPNSVLPTGLGRRVARYQTSKNLYVPQRGDTSVQQRAKASFAQGALEANTTQFRKLDGLNIQQKIDAFSIKKLSGTNLSYAELGALSKKIDIELLRLGKQALYPLRRSGLSAQGSMEVLALRPCRKGLFWEKFKANAYH